ncbi:hypothetical protein [Mesorhizobium sp.]|uniref:hypothetical protein n=1 Tax=Mesorhizobium sp. TaxID=1871066 RepID=UPI0025811A4B|nr:hypothetical protein [Mesorhizobium sp.]
MAELKLRGARKSYGSVETIKGLDLDVWTANSSSLLARRIRRERRTHSLKPDN